MQHLSLRRRTLSDLDAAVLATLSALLGFWFGGHLGVRKLQSILEGACNHSWIYHSLHFAGEHWNRVCRICGRHETRWTDNPDDSVPPPGAKLAKGEAPRDDNESA